MKVRVLTDAIVGAGHFLMVGDEVELTELGEFAEAMLRDRVIELVDSSHAIVEAAKMVNPASLL
jgi:hypothetical protein